jgi:hypothetical protein
MTAFISMVFALVGGCLIGHFIKKGELCWAGFAAVVSAFNFALACGVRL